MNQVQPSFGTDIHSLLSKFFPHLFADPYLDPNVSRYQALQPTPAPSWPLPNYNAPPHNMTPPVQPTPQSTPMPQATPQTTPQPQPNSNMAAVYQNFLRNVKVDPGFLHNSPPPDLMTAIGNASRQTGIPMPILLGIAGGENVALTNTRGSDQHGQGYFQIDDRYYPQTPQFNPYNPAQAALKAAQIFQGNVGYYQQNPTSGYGPVEAAMRAYNSGRGGNLGGTIPSQDYGRFTNYAAVGNQMAANQGGKP